MAMQTRLSHSSIVYGKRWCSMRTLVRLAKRAERRAMVSMFASKIMRVVSVDFKIESVGNGCGKPQSHEASGVECCDGRGGVMFDSLAVAAK